MNPFGRNSRSACPASDCGRENPGKGKATKCLICFPSFSRSRQLNFAFYGNLGHILPTVLTTSIVKTQIFLFCRDFLSSTLNWTLRNEIRQTRF